MEGMTLQSTWRPKINKDHDFYARIYVSKFEQKDADIFSKWFQLIKEKTRAYNANRDIYLRLVIFLFTMKLVSCVARNPLATKRKNITIIKLPAHTADVTVIQFFMNASVFKAELAEMSFE